MQMISLTGEPAKENNCIVLGGIGYDIGTRCRRWDDEDGYDGYIKSKSVVKTVDNKTGKKKNKIIKGNRFSKRAWIKNPINKITQLFVHHSGADRKDPGVMYDVLYKQRGLSVHFAVEDDGRVWQFNDMIDSCWHGGKHNPISIGTECCLYPLASKRPRYYDEDKRKRTGNLPHATRIETVHGRDMKVFCFPEQQWQALSRIYAAAWVAVGHQRTRCFENEFNGPPMFPRNDRGDIPMTVYPKAKKHIGLIGHLQCTRRKIDPSGFPWQEFEDHVADRYWVFKDNFLKENSLKG